MLISFEPLTNAHFPLLLRWLEAPHVKKWWDRECTYTADSVFEKYNSYVKGYKIIEGQKKPIQAFIILANHNPVGYIQIYNPYDFPKEKVLTGLPSNLGALDFFLGEESVLHQGIGSKGILEFIKVYGERYSHIFLAVNIHNIAAIRCYEKAGFLRISKDKHTDELWLLKPRDMIESSIAQELIENHNCIAIILYGSRARGDYNSNSDYDIFGITRGSQEKRIARFEQKFQVYYDIFISPADSLYPVKNDNFKLKDGFCIYDTDQVGTLFLENIKKEANKPIESSIFEIEAIKIWHLKMANRAAMNDLEGKYRRIWLIYALLEDYFTLRNIRYEGPKIAFKYLKQHDVIAYQLFESLLTGHNNDGILNALIAHIANSSPNTNI